MINGKIVYKGDVKVGDSVRLTKKVDLFDSLGIINKKLDITVTVDLQVGKKLKLSSGGVTVETESEITKSINSPITKSEVIQNLNKTDVYPYKVTVIFNNFDDNAFIPKSVFNKLRAELYSNLFYVKTAKKPYIIAKYTNNYNCKTAGGNGAKSAVIVSNLSANTALYDEVILAPYDYNNLPIEGVKNVWLYLPPFTSCEDIKIIKDKIKHFKGVYADGVWGLELCRELNVKLFAGVGFNVFNSIDVNSLISEGVDKGNICASKELSLLEISNLKSDLFVLSNGLIEVMDLIYCPFGKNCKNCEIINDFELVDSENRVFPVKRYKLSECRFKVYNMAKLKEVKNYSTITDLSLKVNLGATQGNLVKGIK